MKRSRPSWIGSTIPPPTSADWLPTRCPQLQRRPTRRPTTPWSNTSIDEDPAVRRAVYLAIGRINAPLAADVIVTGLQVDKLTDDYLADGMVRASGTDRQGGHHQVSRAGRLRRRQGS